MVETVHDLGSADQWLQRFDIYREIGFKFFLPVGQFIAVWPQTWKWSKPRANQTQVNPSYFPMESLEEDVQCERTYWLIQKHICYWLNCYIYLTA